MNSEETSHTHTNHSPSNDFISALLHTHNLTPDPTALEETINVNLAANNFIGCPLPSEKSEDIFRFYFGNPNGFNILPNGGEFSEYMETMLQFDVDMIGNAEINVDTTNYRAKTILHTTTQKLFEHSRLTYASSMIPSTSVYKPGGTLLITHGKYSGRVVNHGTDPLGRWSYQTLSAKNNRRITFIIAYQTCQQLQQQQSTIQSLTAHAQQTSMLRQQGRTTTPRKAFHTDLKHLLTTLQSDHHEILLAGDFNETLSNNISGMTQICAEYNFTDLLFHLTGRDDFPTYVRGTTRRVDYVLCTEWIAQAAVLGSYEPFSYRTKGDHRNIALDLIVISYSATPQHISQLQPCANSIPRTDQQ
jgi:hypothetical protein